VSTRLSGSAPGKRLFSAGPWGKGSATPTSGRGLAQGPCFRPITGSILRKAFLRMLGSHGCERPTIASTGLTKFGPMGPVTRRESVPVQASKPLDATVEVGLDADRIRFPQEAFPTAAACWEFMISMEMQQSI
jgi:hypothetical protein